MKVSLSREANRPRLIIAWFKLWQDKMRVVANKSARGILRRNGIQVDDDLTTWNVNAKGSAVSEAKAGTDSTVGTDLSRENRSPKDAATTSATTVEAPGTEPITGTVTAPPSTALGVTAEATAASATATATTTVETVETAAAAVATAIVTAMVVTVATAAPTASTTVTRLTVEAAAAAAPPPSPPTTTTQEATTGPTVKWCVGDCQPGTSLPSEIFLQPCRFHPEREHQETYHRHMQQKLYFVSGTRLGPETRTHGEHTNNPVEQLTGDQYRARARSVNSQQSTNRRAVKRPRPPSSPAENNTCTVTLNRDSVARQEVAATEATRSTEDSGSNRAAGDANTDGPCWQWDVWNPVDTVTCVETNATETEGKEQDASQSFRMWNYSPWRF